MEDSSNIHSNKSSHNLLDKVKNFLYSKRFIFLFVVGQQITFLTILHDYLHYLCISATSSQTIIIVVWNIIHPYKVGMDEFHHYFNLYMCLLCPKRVNMNFFHCILFSLLVNHPKDCSITALSNSLIDFIDFLSAIPVYLFIHKHLNWYYDAEKKLVSVKYLNNSLYSQFFEIPQKIFETEIKLISLPIMRDENKF